jgi:hypothetical protein
MGIMIYQAWRFITALANIEELVELYKHHQVRTNAWHHIQTIPCLRASFHIV